MTDISLEDQFGAKHAYPITYPNKIRVMWYSNLPTISTGYAQVTREVLRRLANDPRFEIICVAENYSGQPFIFENSFQVIGMNESPAQGANNPGEVVLRYLHHYKPQVLITLEDTFTL